MDRLVIHDLCDGAVRLLDETSLDRPSPFTAGVEEVCPLGLTHHAFLFTIQFPSEWDGARRWSCGYRTSSMNCDILWIVIYRLSVLCISFLQVTSSKLLIPNYNFTDDNKRGNWVESSNVPCLPNERKIQKETGWSRGWKRTSGVFSLQVEQILGTLSAKGIKDLLIKDTMTMSKTAKDARRNMKLV